MTPGGVTSNDGVPPAITGRISVPAGCAIRLCMASDAARASSSSGSTP
jgi:hypothetical protein